jgi:hypothetical protein
MRCTCWFSRCYRVPMSRRKEGTRWQDLPERTHEFDTPHRGPRRHGRTYGSVCDATGGATWRGSGDGSPTI